MSARTVNYVRLSEVQLAPRNPKLHSPGIGTSIAHHGLGELPLRDGRTGRLVAGHGRYEHLVALQAAGQAAPDGVDVAPDGEWLMPVVDGWSSRSDADAEAYLVGSNQLTIAEGWDLRGLSEIISDLRDAELLNLTGFDDAEVAAILADVKESAPPSPPEEFPAYDEDLPTEHRCPACGYEWSGSTRPGAPDE